MNQEQLHANSYYNSGMQTDYSHSNRLVGMGWIAGVYTLLGFGWGLVSISAITPMHRSLVLVGISVSGLLLMASVVEVIQIGRKNRKQEGTEDRGISRWLMILVVDLFLTGMIALVLSLLGMIEWIVVVAALVFGAHFFFIHRSAALWVDTMAGVLMCFTALLTMVFLSQDPQRRTLISGTSGLIACWWVAAWRVCSVNKVSFAQSGGVNDATSG
jgi:hypothetical protein